MKTVSEWIGRGGMKTGWFLFERPVKDSGKAKAFKAKRFNANGNPVDADVWFPKSQIKSVINDYYRESMGVDDVSGTSVADQSERASGVCIGLRGKGNGGS